MKANTVRWRVGAICPLGWLHSQTDATMRLHAPSKGWFIASLTAYGSSNIECSVSPVARHLLRLCEVADGKHDVREDGNPNSVRGDVRNWRRSVEHSDHGGAMNAWLFSA